MCEPMNPAPPVTRIMRRSLWQDAPTTVARVPDVVLPVLDERAALPWVLERMPAGYEPIVVDNGSTDGSGELAAALGAHVVHEPRPGFGAACFAGLVRGARRGRLLHGLRRVVRPAASCRGSPSRSRPARPIWCSAPARVRRLAAARALANRAADRGAAAAHRRRAARPRPDAGRAPRGAARRSACVDRRFGWPLEMVVRAAEAGWRIDEVDVDLPPAPGRSKVTGTVRGTLRTVRDMVAALA